MRWREGGGTQVEMEGRVPRLRWREGGGTQVEMEGRWGYPG